MKRSLAFALASALVALGCSKAPTDADAKIAAEAALREAYGRSVAIDAGAERMLKVASRTDVMFEEGFGMVLYDPPEDFHNHAFRWMGKNGHVRVRRHGDKAMKLLVKGWFHEKVIKTRPVITAYLDGQYLEESKRVADGPHWELEKIIPPWMFRDREWVDLNLLCNAVGFHWSDPPQLNVVVVYDFEWTELP